MLTNWSFDHKRRVLGDMSQPRQGERLLKRREDQNGKNVIALRSNQAKVASGQGTNKGKSPETSKLRTGLQRIEKLKINLEVKRAELEIR